MTEEDYARYIPLLEEMNATLRVVADGQRPLHEACVRIAASLDRMIVRTTQLDRQLDAMNAKLHAMNARLDRMNDRLGAFATDTRRRLERIEVRLGWREPPRPRHGPQRGSRTSDRRRAAGLGERRPG